VAPATLRQQPGSRLPSLTTALCKLIHWLKSCMAAVLLLCSGGALLMRGSSCSGAITWQQAAFTNNSAGEDGGAMYITEMAKRQLAGQGTYEGNTVS
jgi:predicted outer membrane repeat protein